MRADSKLDFILFNINEIYRGLILAIGQVFLFQDGLTLIDTNKLIIMDTAKSAQLNVIIPAYRMHTQTFINVLDGISEKDALKRIENRTNHLVWMAGNYVNVRYSMGNILGIKEEDPYQDLFYMGKTLDEKKEYPTLKQLLDNFHKISPQVYQALLNDDDATLAEVFEMGMQVPFIKEDKLNFIGMCIGREDYLCGQMALMRRILDYPGMKYDVDNSIAY